MLPDASPLSLIVLTSLTRLHRLIAVTPIAGRQAHRGVEIFALALERYTHGSIISFQVQSVGQGPDLGDTAAAVVGPELALRVEDDQGRRYPALLDHGYGAGQGRDWQWRASYRCDPVLDPTARQLWLTIATLAWPALEAAPRRGGTLPTLAGPWVFTVALAPSTW